MADVKMAVIPQFYAGRDIFITGSSGFMGKVLVERLLETCPDIGNLYLLMRVKKNVAPEKRLQQIIESSVFDIIREKCPAQLEKLKVVPGDTTLPGFAISEESLKHIRNVSVVFHSAATLKFDEELRVALQQNVRSVTRLLQIADDHMPQLQVFMHVSTAYSNPDRAEVGECVYPAPATLEQLEALVDALPAPLLDSITKEYIHPKPNTYTFTKAVAEGEVIRHVNRGFPIVIFRPSIVVSSLHNPMPGWIENFNGPSGIIVATGKGIIHSVIGKKNNIADLIPVDIAVDTMIAAAWETAVDRPTDVKVYNCCSNENPITWSECAEFYKKLVVKYPMNNCILYPFGNFTESKFVHYYYKTIVLAYIYFAEYTTSILGIKKSINLVTALQKVNAMTAVLAFFINHEYKFHTDNVKNLKNRLNEEDAKIYNLDIHSIDWAEHSVNFVKGARKYLLRERDEDIPEAKQNMERLKKIHYATLVGVIFFFLFLMLRVYLVFSF